MAVKPWKSHKDPTLRRFSIHLPGEKPYRKDVGGDRESWIESETEGMRTERSPLRWGAVLKGDELSLRSPYQGTRQKVVALRIQVGIDRINRTRNVLQRWAIPGGTEVLELILYFGREEDFQGPIVTIITTIAVQSVSKTLSAGSALGVVGRRNDFEPTGSSKSKK
ncbi:hypothetical protein L218DRAFT_948089 [Marasmius fiardii PR-910]|nr:hypothetical protein L218DRAFT_948089 [Marasmius fiardii PR-910]